jgi:hypothetical protein
MGPAVAKFASQNCDFYYQRLRLAELVAPVATKNV